MTAGAVEMHRLGGTPLFSPSFLHSIPNHSVTFAVGKEFLGAKKLLLSPRVAVCVLWWRP